MIALDVGGQTKNLAKNVIKFTLDDEDDQIEGAMVCQRPEDRIHRNYRRN
jgi:RNase P/RNase MRP subunit p29